MSIQLSWVANKNGVIIIIIKWIRLFITYRLAISIIINISVPEYFPTNWYGFQLKWSPKELCDK